MGDSLDERNSPSDAQLQATNAPSQHSPEDDKTAKHGVETMSQAGENDPTTPSRDKNLDDSDVTIKAETPTDKNLQQDELQGEQNAVEKKEEEEERPPLPPRPSLRPSGESSLTPFTPSNRPALQSRPTTAVASVDVQTRSFSDGLRSFFSIPGYRAVSESLSITGLSTGQSTPGRKTSYSGSQFDDTSSVISHAPLSNVDGDLAGLLDEGLNAKSPAWKLLNEQAESGNPFEGSDDENTSLNNFEHEFDEIDAVDSKGENEEQLLVQFKAKYKHYMILSSAGKPIYSRHGDQNLINGYIGVIQTIISFYEEENDHLLGFTAGGTRFAIKIDGPLYFVAISKLGESDSQLRAQLDALYKQILSTLTLPTLTQLFSNRPNTDLRRPLEGTETLLSSLADTFTRGSPTALLSALECLKVRKSHRHTINNTLLKARTKQLLYGLIVAGGRLVSVVRPKRHSLHPSDLQLIFNMLFEAGGIKAGGGESWIPICLPAFNNKGYLYMYVSFIDGHHEAEARHDAETSDKQSSTSSDDDGRDDEIAVILISANKESFFELKDMRDELVKQLEKNGSMKIIKTAVSQGRPSTTDIVPGTPLKHFLYKSRANVQFTMPSFSPNFSNIIKRRRLMSVYHELHASTHVKYSPVKVLRTVSRESSTLAWITADFEFYCVAGPKASRNALTEGADKVIKWVKREEERVFIIGGAVF